MEGTNIQPGGGRRLVLGFDAGCMTCSELAKGIEEAAGGRLEVLPLHDPLVKHSREQVLGKDAPWAPTLIELGPKGPKVSTGAKLGARLFFSLGPVTAWRVLQALGDIGAPARKETPLDPAWSDRVSRGRFLKGVGGAALAMSMLSGAGRLSSVAGAEAASGIPKSREYTELEGDELFRIARATARRSDATSVMGETWSTALQGGKTVSVDHKGQRVTAIDSTSDAPPQSGKGSSPGHRVAVKAGRHKLEDGNSMLAVAYWDLETDRVLLHHEFEKPVKEGEGRVKTRAALHRAEGENILLERLSVNGKPVELQDSQEKGTSVDGRRVCSGCRSGGNQYFRSYYCASIKWGCLLVACAACIPACATYIGCFYCAGVQCQYAYFVACCRRKGYTCFYCRR